jgi:hypothetical protein
MKLRQLLLSVLITGIFITVSSSAFSQKSSLNYYQFKIYHITKAQESTVDNYLKTAYIPALKRAGIKAVGVFKPIVTDTADQKIYVFIPFSSLEQFDKINPALAKDQQYAAAGKEYLEGTGAKPSYKRIESIILRAVSNMPQPMFSKVSGPKNERVYELRSYEGASENLSTNKIQQINEGSANEGNEIDIFNRLNFNTVFIGEVLSGSRMPNLMYLTTYINKADRDAHWAAFNNDAKWTSLRSLPQYQKNVSRNEQNFLYPVEYSDY